VAAGNFEFAAQQLRTELGIVALGPLKPYFMALALGSHSAMPGVAPLPARMQAMQRNYKTASATSGSPLLAITIDSLAHHTKQGGSFFQKGKFDESLTSFLRVLQSIPFATVESRPQLNEVKKLQNTAREYVLGLKVNLASKADGVSKPRLCELAAYFTNCALEPQHLVLTLQQAMTFNAKLKNFGTAASFARRLLEMAPNKKQSDMARKVMAAADQNNSSDAVSLDYDPKNPFVLCAMSFKPIYRGTPSTKCGYCGASYMMEFKSQVCNVCEIGEIGADVVGMQQSLQAYLQAQGGAE